MDWGQEEIRCKEKAVKHSEVASQDGEDGSEEGLIRSGAGVGGGSEGVETVALVQDVQKCPGSLFAPRQA